MTALLCLLFAGASTANEPPATPDFPIVVRAVEASFASLTDYQAGDLISRSQIERALAGVKDAGWDVPNADALVQLGLADNSFLVTRLSTSAGRKFMRKLSREPGAYARLDRLSTISRGKALVNDLIHRKGGDELIKYLVTTQGGHQLGKQMASTRQGVDLNKPTGRIYTADDLLAALKRLHEKSAP